jgi:hypothetical protein
MNRAIASARLRNQRIEGRPVGGDPAAVVSLLGAVQSQEFDAAKWALGLRMGARARDAAIERAFDEGRILRTHVLRPTWHFVAPDDIRWMLALTAPHVRRPLAAYHRRLELGRPLLTRAIQILERALGDAGPLTRQDLRGRLATAGITLDSMRLAFVMMEAELDAVVCSGPRRGRHFTYALLAGRTPNAGPLPRDEAIGTLVRRYFASHGPATIRDFVWWSGLSTADTKRGLEIVRARHTSVDGQGYWTVGRNIRDAPGVRSSSAAHLLPIYDEYLVAYRDRAAVPHSWQPSGATVAFRHALVLDGQVAGTWRTANDRTGTTMTMTTGRRLTTRERHAVREAATRYERFLGCEIRVRGIDTELPD